MTQDQAWDWNAFKSAGGPTYAGGAGHPGIRDVIGAVLVGTLVGAPVGGAAAWLARLVSLPGSRRRA